MAVPWALEAQEILARDWGVSADVWSVTSYTELAREARDVERWNRLHPVGEQRRSYVGECLDGDIPVVAASDYVRAVPQLIATYIKPRYTVLGTDGYGRSDTRSALRDFFEVDQRHIAVATLAALAQQGVIEPELCAAAIDKYGVNIDATPSWEA